MTISDRQLVCTRPFEWFEVHPDGSVFLCCPAWLKRPIGNLLQQDVVDIWNSSVACEIRKSVLNGSFHNCNQKRCPHLRNRTQPVCSQNQLEDGELKSTLESGNGYLLSPPRHLNLCFDTSCNLACPSCRTQLQQATGPALQQARQISKILQQKLLPVAESITVSGFGDPLASPTYFSLLQDLNRGDYPELQQVRLHSNGLLLTEKQWQQLPGLQPLVSAIEISIDAASESTYRKNRPGGDFSQLLQNLDFLAKINCQLTLSMVVQQNNWREIPLLLALAKKLGAQAYLSQLVNWGTFSCEQFLQRAVHLPNHPEHPNVQRLLSEIAEDPRVTMNLDG